MRFKLITIYAISFAAELCIGQVIDLPLGSSKEIPGFVQCPKSYEYINRVRLSPVVGNIGIAINGFTEFFPPTNELYKFGSSASSVNASIVSIKAGMVTGSGNIEITDRGFCVYETDLPGSPFQMYLIVRFPAEIVYRPVNEKIRIGFERISDSDTTPADPEYGDENR